MDNGTEFKNKDVETKCSKDWKWNTESLPSIYHNAIDEIEGFYMFLKACIGKQIQQGLEWDDLIWKATAAYNFFPVESSRFFPFFLMYGHEANAKHMILAEETTKISWWQWRCFKCATHNETITGCCIQLGKIKSSTWWKQTEKKELQTKTHPCESPSTCGETTQQSLLKQEAMTTYV